jgi:hypothetical protein
MDRELLNPDHSARGSIAPRPIIPHHRPSSDLFHPHRNSFGTGMVRNTFGSVALLRHSVSTKMPPQAFYYYVRLINAVCGCPRCVYSATGAGGTIGPTPPFAIAAASDLIPLLMVCHHRKTLPKFPDHH